MFRLLYLWVVYVLHFSSHSVMAWIPSFLLLRKEDARAARFDVSNKTRRPKRGRFCWTETVGMSHMTKSQNCIWNLLQEINMIVDEEDGGGWVTGQIGQ